MSPVAVLVALFVVYVLAVTWQMRRAVRAPEGLERLTEARRLLLMVSLGIPLLVGFIFATL
jgi:hypothetical protein